MHIIGPGEQGDPEFEAGYSGDGQDPQPDADNLRRR